MVYKKLHSKRRFGKGRTSVQGVYNYGNVPEHRIKIETITSTLRVVH